MIYANNIFSGFDFVLLRIILQEAEIRNQGKTVFAQIMSLIPRYEFDKCVKRYNGNRHAVGFKCRDQFMVMSFAQFTHQDSLRSIDASLVGLSANLYSSGIKYIQRSTLAHINETKDWHIYRDFGLVLIAWARDLYKDEPSRLDVDGIVYAFDSSTIKLCLQLCPWARLHHDKGGVKMHTLLDLRGSIPTFIHLTEAAVHDSKVMSLIPVEPGNYYLMDKGYVDFHQLFNHFHRQQAFFVTRAKDNMQYEIEEERLVDKSTGVLSDSVIRLAGQKTSKWYPETLRMVVYEDYATGNVYRFLTNDFTHSYLTIAELYRERWQVECFFKWIKHHLHIESFYGTSENAVNSQIWIAICDYLLLAIAKKMYHVNQELYILSSAIGSVLFQRKPLGELFVKSNDPLNESNPGELSLF
jgi:hypothetical protein